MIKGIMVLISLIMLSILPTNSQAQTSNELKKPITNQPVSKIQKNKKAASKWLSNYRSKSRISGSEKSISGKSVSSSPKGDN